jgi:porin
MLKSIMPACALCFVLFQTGVLRADDTSGATDLSLDLEFDAAYLGAFQDDTQGASTAQPPADQPPAETVWTRKELTGDWWGARTAMADKGLTVDLRLTQFLQGVASGGVNETTRYGGLIDYVFNLDGEKLGLWKGSYFNMHARTQFGNSVDGAAGAFTFPNTVMLWPLPDYHGTAITGLYYMQMVSPKVGLIVGKLDVLDIWTMIYPHTGGGYEGFMNLNVIAAALPWFRWVNLSVMGGGGLVMHDDGQIEGGLLVFDTQNASTTTGFNDMFDNGVGILGLWRLFFEMDDKPGTILFAFGGSTGTYDSLDPTDWEFIPGLGAVGSPTTGTWSGGIFYDQVFWQDSAHADRNLRLFTGWSVSDGNPSFGKFSGFASLEATGMLFGRDKDRAGVGAFYSELSRDIKNLASPVVTLGDAWGVEAYYNFEVTPWFHLTGDIQVVQGAVKADDAAVILGMRAVLDF